LAIRTKIKAETDDFFLSNRRGALSRKTAWLAIRNYGEQTELSLPADPHMLAVLPWQIKGQTQGSFRTILDSGASSTLFIYTASKSGKV
jgi:hypothetical protein